MISSRPLVSVVIPTRNRPTLVLRAVRSALRQTLREIEVIVVIDGESGSASADAVARAGRGPGPLHRVTGNGGRREARNIGIRDARSPWIALLDDDDEWLPAKLEMQMEAAHRHAGEQQVVVTCQHIHRAEDAVDVVRPRRLPRPGEPPGEFMFDYLCYFQTSTFFCSKELMLRIPFTKGLPFFQDIDWFCEQCATQLPSLSLSRNRSRSTMRPKTA